MHSRRAIDIPACVAILAACYYTPRVHAVTCLECVRGNPRRYIGAAFAAPLALAGSLGAPSACEGAGALGVLWHAL